MTDRKLLRGSPVDDETLAYVWLPPENRCVSVWRFYFERCTLNYSDPAKTGDGPSGFFISQRCKRVWSH